MRARIVGQYVLLAALAAILVIFLMWPLWLTLQGGFVDQSGGFTLAPLRLALGDPAIRAGLVNAALIATATTVLATAIALPLALFQARFEFPGRRVFSALVLAPLILPPFVGAIGMRQILGRSGSLNALLGTEFDILGTAKVLGVIVVEALHLYPIIYLNAVAAAGNLDPALEEAAANVGAGRWRRLWRITMPLLRPGLFAGGTIVFIWSLTELGTPLMFEYYQVTPVQIFVRIKEMSNSAQPFALTAILLAAAIVFYVLGKFVFGGRSPTMDSRTATGSRTAPLSRFKGWLAAGMFAIVCLTAILPHVGVILASFAVDGQWYESVLPRRWTTDHYVDALGHPLAMGSILNSLKYATAAMAVTTVLGLAIGWISVRSRVVGRQVLDALAMLPLAVPGLVMAFGYVALSIRMNGMAEAHGGVWRFIADRLDILGPTADPFVLLVIAYAIRRLPYMVRSTAAGLEQTSRELDDAARNLGAGPMTTLRRITVPLIAANLVAGGLLVFSFSMLEVSDSLILAQREGDYPVTKAIYTFFERLGDGQSIASAMGVWGMCLLAVTLLGAAAMLGKRMGAVFRV